MITLSFRRFGNGVYISHTDVLRSLNRTMRRAGIDVNYSKGFNRHMSLKLSQPLPLGIASDEEWVTADVVSELDKEEFFRLFSENCPPFIQPTAIYVTDKNPSLAAKIVASDYEIICPEADGFAEEIEKLKDGFVAVTTKDGQPAEKDYTGYVRSVEVKNGVIYCRFCFGNKNLRADVFAAVLKEKFNLDVPLSAITRKRQLVESGEGLIPAARYMESIADA